MSLGDRSYGALPLLGDVGARPQSRWSDLEIQNALRSGYFSAEWDGALIGFQDFPFDFADTQNYWAQGNAIRETDFAIVTRGHWRAQEEWTHVVVWFLFGLEGADIRV